MLIEGISRVLAANANLQALLGTSTTRKDATNGLFPINAPSQVPMPYVVYQQVSGAPLQTSNAGTGALREERWRFSCYGTTYKKAQELGRVLNQVMISIVGTLPAGEAEVHGVWETLAADDFENLPHATIYACHRDYNIVYVDGDTD